MGNTFRTNGGGKTAIAVTSQPINIAGIACNRLDIQALKSNSGPIVIGDFSVTSDQANGGIQLYPGEVYLIELLKDATNIFIVGTAGDAVSYNWYIGDRV